MIPSIFRHKSILLHTSILLLAIMTGCKPIQATQKPTDSPQAPTSTVTIEPTAAPARLLLIDPAGTASDDLTTFLNDFSAANGLFFETTAEENQPALGEGTRVVIYLSSPENLMDTVSANSNIQFILWGMVDPTGHNNLSVIKSQPQDMAFMAGYLTTIIAWDWRSSGLIPNDTLLGEGYAQAFENGGRYVCGQCTPYYAPYYYFPLILEEPSSSDSAIWQDQINSLIAYYVDSVFVDPAAALPEVMNALTAQEYTLIGQVGTASPEKFTALLDYDLLPELKELLPQALAGNGGQIVAARVKIAFYSDPELISPAKIELFNKTAADLTTGWLSPMSVP